MDVSMNYAAMESSSRAYRNMRDLLEASTAGMDDVDSSAVPQDVLRDRLSDLHDSWGSGIDKLAEFSEGAGKAVDTALDAFRSFDSDTAAAFEGDGGSA